jgi:hypothetical protein
MQNPGHARQSSSTDNLVGAPSPDYFGAVLGDVVSMKMKSMLPVVQMKYEIEVPNSSRRNVLAEEKSPAD